MVTPVVPLFLRYLSYHLPVTRMSFRRLILIVLNVSCVESIHPSRALPPMPPYSFSYLHPFRYLFSSHFCVVIYPNATFFVREFFLLDLSIGFIYWVQFSSLLLAGLCSPYVSFKSFVNSLGILDSRRLRYSQMPIHLDPQMQLLDSASSLCTVHHERHIPTLHVTEKWCDSLDSPASAPSHHGLLSAQL